ncbi:MAG: recombination mediator RecR [Candidatus Omnitrophota bacterium]
MKGYPKSMIDLIKEFGRMPGIGSKTAQRLAFHILKSPSEDVKKMAEAMLKVKSSVRFCGICNNLSDSDICEICSNPSRDKRVICVVEKPNDVISIEKMGGYGGVYHVLLGALSPLDGIGPKDLKIDDLVKRVKSDKVKEVIIATDSHTEGEATALYLTRILRNSGPRMLEL